jgi:hypothetical protein
MAYDLIVRHLLDVFAACFSKATFATYATYRYQIFLTLEILTRGKLV